VRVQVVVKVKLHPVRLPDASCTMPLTTEVGVNLATAPHEPGVVLVQPVPFHCKVPVSPISLMAVTSHPGQSEEYLTTWLLEA
jgi:hypothetical protein